MDKTSLILAFAEYRITLAKGENSQESAFALNQAILTNENPTKAAIIILNSIMPNYFEISDTMCTVEDFKMTINKISTDYQTIFNACDQFSIDVLTSFLEYEWNKKCNLTNACTVLSQGVDPCIKMKSLIVKNYCLLHMLNAFLSQSITISRKYIDTIEKIVAALRSIEGGITKNMENTLTFLEKI